MMSHANGVMSRMLAAVLGFAVVCTVHRSFADELPPRPAVLEPTWILKPADTHLRLDAWNYASFTTNETGGVTAWADQGGNGHNATAYQIGDDQVYGSVGLTNGVPAYLMGPLASRIDLRFERCATIRTIFWVMDIVGQHNSDTANVAFILGDSYAYGWDFHGSYAGAIAGDDANAAFRNGLFRIDGDGSYSGQLTTTYAPAGTHLYTSVPTANLGAGQLSRDRNSSTTRVGGRALSELIILTRPLETNEIETVETYLNAKWFGAAETLAAEVEAKAEYPSLTLDAGAGLVIRPAAYAKGVDVPCVAVFGTLRKGTAAKVRIVSGITEVPSARTILACGAAAGVNTLDDFELVGFPSEARFAWDGTKLTMTCDRTRAFVPAILRSDATHRASLWLDATDAASFTTNETGGVTAWADKSGSGHDAVAYMLGDEQKYGVRGVTNGCPAFLMGECGSDIDLRFVPKTAAADDINVGAAYWVMDVVREVPYTGNPWPTAFFLGGEGYWDFHRGQQSPYQSMIADGANAPAFGKSDFRIDGVTTNPTQTKPALGTHIYAANMTNALCHAGFLSGDRGIAKRNGGRALSELVIFGFTLTDDEKAQMDNYLNAKWYGAQVTLAAETNAVSPISFPGLVLDDGASFRICSTALRTASAGVSVFGTLQKGTAAKVRIAFVGAPIGVGTKTLFECADLYGYAKSDFEVTGLPADVIPYWDGNALKIDLVMPDVEPTVLKAAGTAAPWLWLDAADDATFTRNGQGGVTAWADKGAYGHDATAYQVGADQVYGTVGVTNGVPAYLMGAVGSRIDLRFPVCTAVRTIFWVMDIADAGWRAQENSYMAFFLGAADSTDIQPYAMRYCFHRGYNGQITSSEAHDNFRSGDFAVDGDHSYSGNLTTTYPKPGTHLYAAVTKGDCAASQLSRDRGSSTRVSGRALSELVIFDRELTSAEYASVENYLNAKWFMKSVTLSEAVSVTSPVTYPYLTLDEGASFTVSRAALPRNDAAITVYGALARGSAGKVRIAFADAVLPSGERTLLRCADAVGLTLGDFELVGFPSDVEFSWDGHELKTVNTLGLILLVK